MNLINREALMFSLVFSDETGNIPCGQMKTILEVVKAQPLAQLEIIHCRDCKHYAFADNRAFGFPAKRCEWTGFEDVDDDDFCSRAERREEKHETN